MKPTHCIQIHHADGSLEQIFTADLRELRTALLRHTKTATADQRGHIIGSALTGTTPVRHAPIGAGRTVSIVTGSEAYRPTLAKRSTDHGEERKFSRSMGTTPSPTGPARPANATGRTLDGYAVVWDAEYPITESRGSFMEHFERGAFTESLRTRWPIAQFDHGAHPILGSLPLLTYDKVLEDSHGLRVVGQVADGWLLEPFYDAIRDGRISGMSIRFVVTRETWSRSRDKRAITGAVLYEAGPVVMPASPTTSIGIRGTGHGRTKAQRQALAGDLRSPK